MRGIVRHILAIVCIAAYICGGQMSACGCNLEVKSASTCETHDHSHDSEHKDHTPASDATCPCVACHACSHAPVIMPQFEFALPTLQAEALERTAHPALSGRSLEIFTPPKLS